MINRKNMSGESGFFAVTAIAICVVLLAGIVGLLSPAAATPGVSSNSTLTPPPPIDSRRSQLAPADRSDPAHQLSLNTILRNSPTLASVA